VSEYFILVTLSDLIYSNVEADPSNIVLLPAINELVLQNVLPYNPIVRKSIEFLVDLRQLSHFSAI